jgi:hypothetical protein
MEYFICSHPDDRRTSSAKKMHQLINSQMHTFNHLKLIASHQRMSSFKQNLDAAGVERRK